MNASDAAPRARRKDLRPGEITAAALEMFVEHGYAATRLEDVAARAGVSKGTVYLYFENKEALFKAVVRESIVPAIAQGEGFLREHRGSAADLLRGLLWGWWERIGSTPLGGIPKLMVAEARNFPELGAFYVDEVVNRARALIGEAVQRGIASGEFRRDEAQTLVSLVISPLMMHSVWRHSLGCCEAGRRDERAYIAAAIEFAVRGLAPDAPEN